MSAFDFDDLFQSLKTGIISTAKDTIDAYVTQAQADGEAVLGNLKVDLQRWTQELENEQITLDDLSFLLEEEKDLFEMTALKQVGLAEVQLNEFKSGIVKLIVGTISTFLKL